MRSACRWGLSALAILILPWSMPAWAEERPYLLFVSGANVPYSMESGYVSNRLLIRGGDRDGQMFEMVSSPVFAPGSNPTAEIKAFFASSRDATRHLGLLEQSAAWENLFGLSTYGLLFGGLLAVGLAFVPPFKGAGVADPSLVYLGAGMACVSVLPLFVWLPFGQQSARHQYNAVASWNGGL